MAKLFECSLCLDDIEKENEFETKCGHKFHESCFMNLTIENKYKDCPLCRNEFEEEWVKHGGNGLLAQVKQRVSSKYLQKKLGVN